MKTLFTQAVLFVASAGLCLVQYGSSLTSVCIILLTLIFCCLPTALEQLPQTSTATIPYSKIAYHYFLPFYLLGAYVYSGLLCFLPVFLLPCFQYKAWFSLSEGVLFLLFHTTNNFSQNVLCTWFCLTFSLLLSLEHYSSNFYKEKYIQLMDESSEQALQLKRINKKLIEAQDATVHTATLTERNRIAREIHDNVGHIITRALLQTGALEALNKDESVTPMILGVKESLSTAMNSIRTSVHDMHDDTIHLEAALKDLLKETTRFETTLIYDCSAFLPKQIKYTIMAISQEALNNSLKHSNGTKFQILLREHPSFYQLILSDNGCSQGKPTDHEGIGLTNIRDRVHAVNGTVHFSTKQGFEIRITIMKN